MVVVVVVVGLDGYISKQRELTCGSVNFCCAGFIEVNKQATLPI